MAAFSLVHLVVLLAVLALVVAVIGFGVRGWRRRGLDVTVSVALSGSAVVAVVSLLMAVGTAISVMTATTVAFTIPVSPFWPAPPAGVTITDGPTAVAESGGFTTADVDVSGASAGARLFWALGQGIGFLVPAAIAALIAIACFQLLRGAAFARVVVRASMTTAVVVLVGGVATAVLSQIGGSMVSHELLTVTAVTAATGAALADGTTDLGSLLPQPTMSIQVPFWPIGAGLGFAALAAIFRHGARLQHDTELLV